MNPDFSIKSHDFHWKIMLFNENHNFSLKNHHINPKSCNNPNVKKNGCLKKRLILHVNDDHQTLGVPLVF